MKLFNLFRKKNPIHNCEKQGHIIEFSLFGGSNQVTGCYKCVKCKFLVLQADLTEEENKQYWNKAINTDGRK